MSTTPLPGPDQSPLDFRWDKSTTEREAIERAIYALAERLTATVHDEGDQWRVCVYPRDPETDSCDVGHWLRQEVNDQALRVSIAQQSEPLRNLVFALAFSRSGLVRLVNGPSDA